MDGGGGGGANNSRVIGSSVDDTGISLGISLGLSISLSLAKVVGSGTNRSVSGTVVTDDWGGFSDSDRG